MSHPDYKTTRNTSLRKEFAQLYQKKHLQIAYCIDRLSQKYGLAPSTVERILRYQGRYKE